MSAAVQPKPFPPIVVGTVSPLPKAHFVILEATYIVDLTCIGREFVFQSSIKKIVSEKVEKCPCGNSIGAQFPFNLCIHF